MSSAEILDQLRALPPGERSQVIRQIWAEFGDSEFPVTEAQATELDRRLEEHFQNPDDVVKWSEVRRSAERSQGR